MWFLATLHIFIIALTNVSVQFPFVFLGFHSTWGVFSYPLIFIITDLTVRLLGASTARRTIRLAMIPGLMLSYIMANFSALGDGKIADIFIWNELAFRVAFASFSAYLVGQLLDITVFQRLRQNQHWWVAPTASGLVGNSLDTVWFFFIAFYHSSNPFFAAHWMEIAMVDLGFKLFISLISFIPLYGILLKWLKPTTHKAAYIS